MKIRERIKLEKNWKKVAGWGGFRVTREIFRLPPFQMNLPPTNKGIIVPNRNFAEPTKNGQKTHRTEPLRFGRPLPEGARIPACPSPGALVIIEYCIHSMVCNVKLSVGHLIWAGSRTEVVFCVVCVREVQFWSKWNQISIKIGPHFDQRRMPLQYSTYLKRIPFGSK